MENSGLMSFFKQETIMFQDAVEFVGYASPIIVATFLLLTSVSNADAKGFIWLAFSVLGIFLLKLFKKPFQSFHEPDAMHKCKIKNQNSGTDTPSSSAFFLMSTIAYMFFPMLSNNSFNIYILIGLLIIYAVDAMVKLKNSCTGVMGILAGSLFGIAYGFGIYAMFHYNQGNKYTYFSVGSSNNTYCSKPKSQTFKCNVYKNGQIISSL